MTHRAPHFLPGPSASAAWLTCFRRDLLLVGLACLTLLLSAAIVRAQSFEDAVRANVALATRLCAAAMFTGTPPETLFGSGGFAYRAMDRGVNEFGIHRGTGHYFDAPAGTTKAEVSNVGAPAGLCKVMTTHMPEVPFAALVSAVLLEADPRIQTTGHHQWTIRQGASLPLIVSVSTISRHRYEAPGTVEVSMSFPG